MGTKWSYQSINVKLCYRSVADKKLFHVIVPEGERFSWKDFISLKNFLRSKFTNNFNKELYQAGTPRLLDGGATSYEDQPVYEYHCNVKELREAIEEFSKTKLDLGDCEFSFSTIDYDYIASLNSVPLDILHAGETFLGELNA